jgi:hypothetical protein
MSLKLNSSGGGSVTLQEPVTASAHTLNLPNVDGTVVAADGSGNIVASGTITGTSVLDASGNVRSVPQNSQTSAYILVASDNGKHISITTGGVTVPSGVFSIGDTVTIFNNSGSSQTITQGGSVTLRQVGTANTGNRTLAQYGLATVLCVASNTFVITGGGLT